MTSGDKRLVLTCYITFTNIVMLQSFEVLGMFKFDITKLYILVVDNARKFKFTTYVHLSELCK